MRRLVGDLLLLARADAGRQAPRRAVDLAAAVRDAAVEAGPLAEGHPLSLDVPDEPGVAMVQGSGDDLHRLALNLIENAFLHTPTGTPVVASVRHEDDRVVLEVADRGPGVPRERRNRVFERFARSDAGRTATGGSGLGLAIVRAVAEAHGGSVELREAEGGGALFSVTLPALVAHPAPVSGVLDQDADPNPIEPKGAETS
jgi:signal transduction histidine kinase